MTAVFERILEMSVMAAVVIVVVLLIRLLLRKAPRKYSYALWSVAAFRLVCPVSFKSVFSIFRFGSGLGLERMNVPQTVSHIVSHTNDYDIGVPLIPPQMPSVTTTTPPTVGIISPSGDFVGYVEPTVTVSLVDRIIAIAAVLWLVGLAALLIYGIVSYLRLRRRMSTAVLMEGNVWQSDRVQSPFILGFIRPKIYLPFGLNEDQQRYVLAHEKYHLKRLDHIVRPLSFLILAVHWFNPLVWVAYYMMSRDMEMSCDEKVLSGGESVKAYSTTLLSFAANRRFPSPSPLAFGESGVKGRIKNALNWKKPRTWVTIIAIIVCIVVIIVCAANPASHPRDWTKDLTVEDVDWAELMVNGTDRSYRSLSEEELEELVGLLNGLRRSEMKQPPPLTVWGFPTERMVTVCCNGIEYKLNLGPSPMTLICNDEAVAWGNDDPWFVGNEELKDFVRNLPESREADLGNSTSYVSSRCTYWNPARSDLRIDDSCLSYVIGSNLIEITSMSSGEMIARFENPPVWKLLSDSAWEEMFVGTGPDLSAYVEKQICRLSDEYVLISLDGTLWILYLVDVPNYNHLVWDAYELTPAVQAEADSGYYQSVECIFMSALSSVAALPDSGYYYLLQDDELRLISKTYGSLTLYAADGGWQELSDELIHKMEWGTVALGGTDLWDTLREQRPMIRLYVGDYKFLLNFGDELWVGSYHYDHNGYISLWDLYRLEKLNEEPILPVEELGTWYSDLTHDGVDEVITLRRQSIEVPFGYSLTVATSYGKELWRGDASDWRGGHNGFYLYENDGKSYLMEWCPSDQQGWYNFSYKVFSFRQAGEVNVLEEKTLTYDLGTYNYEENLLAINILDVRSFEWEVNVLLKDAIPLLVMHDGGETILGDPSNPVTDQWTSPANDWERERTAILKNREDREARTLAVWPLNDLTLTVLEGDYEIYTIDVYNGDYYLWQNSFSRHSGDIMYFRYEEDGVQYLMELCYGGSQGAGIWYYSIFSIGPEFNNILRENSLHFTATGVTETLAVDVRALEAFVAEVDGLLEHAEYIAGFTNGKFSHGTPGMNMVYGGEPLIVETIRESQSYWQEKERELKKLIAEQCNTYYVRNLMQSGGKGHGQFVMLDKYMDKRGAVAYVVASFIETDRDGNFLAVYSNIPMMFTFDMVDEEYVLTEAWIEEKGKNFDAHDELKQRFPAYAVREVINGTYAAELHMKITDSMDLPIGLTFRVEKNDEVTVPTEVLDFAYGYICSNHPDAQAAQIDSMEEIPTAAIGTTSGHLMYRFAYSVMLDGAWQEQGMIYLVLHHDWSSSSEYWYSCGTVTQQEIDTIYSTEAMMKQYNDDPYLAAVLETVRKWRTN